MLYLAEFQARNYYSIKLLQSIVSHPVKHKAVYFVGCYIWLNPPSSSEKCSLPCSQTSRLLSDLPCANPSLCCSPILSHLDWHWSQATTLLPSPISLHAWEGVCSLFWPDFARKGVDKICSLLFHILSWSSCWKCLKSYSWQQNPRFTVSSNRTGRSRMCP